MEVSRSYPRHLVKFCIFSHVLSFHLSPFICPVICPFIWSSFIKLSDGGFQCKFIRTFFCQNWKLYWKRKKILVALTTRLQGERKMVKVNSVSECLDIGTQHNACASGRIWCLWSEKNMTWNLESRTVTIKIQKRNSDAVKRGRSTRYHNSFFKWKNILLSSIETFYKALIV